ncbi:conserved Plasmodium protein, unknown function [Plasmodium knowlesi strain H]|uniref:Secreted ookinete protein 25 n=3 Tax=Plasmodium knowlesi TaxID=5850 RepID=A0A5K1TWA0_PLAKH|nr:secreted ookinete protein 25, putative [Plasmodium knowlesi strain H]OTN64737.1 Uncharacterized protein PKNOH_S130197400 [Plasmodium knowlesi]CAA9989134.1 secreted ookinete protein 25, putative [Plasmodium knowlesi strain H]SBO27352.1 conserved Plasmodium protein, unknown function [Plasmodium knowlesi strain H]SBO27534.1 conserved Plasmodium protein, unknown function [Plasmodium knowlesi strain H]VVS78608.1 secreted ookinete protein 25, putative [Plasmodium knowlesi strain H]|eukprot:XP_002261481.1 hypothetical protein, conserved in Plasmodium species [Plasmodium knowlesi strain H]
MAKTCYFPFLFLTYFFLSSTLLAVARSDDRYVDNESAPEVYQRRDDNTAVVPQEDSLLQNSEPVVTLNEKIELLTKTYASNLSKYVSSMRELFHLYNSIIDIKEDLNYGSITLDMEFPDRKGSDDFANFNIIFSARKKNEVSKKYEYVNATHSASFNLDELLRENKDVNGLDNVSFGTRVGEDVISGDSTNVCKAIKGSELDATKLFITVNKEGEDKFSVSNLDDFVGECLKDAQDALAQRDASDKKKKKDGNLQSVYPVSGSEASGSQANSSQNIVQKPKENRKALMDDFKESLVSKNMARCKASAKLLMANSTVSSLMYLFIVIALGICLM